MLLGFRASPRLAFDAVLPTTATHNNDARVFRKVWTRLARLANFLCKLHSCRNLLLLLHVQEDGYV